MLTQSPDKVFNGDSQQFAQMLQWIHEHCVPLVREITFENGEEMTEEGLPLLILFYHPDQPEVKETFKQRVEAELRQHRGVYMYVHVIYLLKLCVWWWWWCVWGWWWCVCGGGVCVCGGGGVCVSVCVCVWEKGVQIV